MRRARALAIAVTILAAGRAYSSDLSPPREASGSAGAFSWKARQGITLACVVSGVRSNGVDTQRLTVVSDGGKVLFSREGEKLEALTQLFLPAPYGDRSLLLVQWLSSRGQELLVLDYLESVVKLVNDLFSRGQYFGLLDLDGDGIPELLAFDKSDSQGEAEVSKAIVVTFYKWQGDMFRKHTRLDLRRLIGCVTALPSR